MSQQNPLPPLVIEKGNSPLIELIVQDVVKGTYPQTATVLLTMVDEAGVNVVGQTWPTQLVYAFGTQGKYRTILEDDVIMEVGQYYKAKFDVTVDGIPRHAERDVFVTEAFGAELPATNPKSPAFKPPSNQELLNEARATLQQIMRGGQVIAVTDQNGEKIEYSAANVARLTAYVASLEMQLGLRSGRPMRVYL